MLCLGEIIESYPPNDPRNLNKVRTEYLVRSVSPSGAMTTYNNCIIMQNVGGVDDFSELVVQTTSNDAQSPYFEEYPVGAGSTVDTDVSKQIRRIGARCVLSFMGPNETLPIIIGFLPFEIYSEDGEELLQNVEKNEDQILNRPINIERMGPMWRMRMNGVNLHIDELGQYRIQHTGVPSVALQDGYYGYTEWGNSLLTTTLDFLQNGEFRLVDGQQQGLVINPDKKYISLNNTIEIPNKEYDPLEEVLIHEPQEDSLSPLGEEIRLDKENKALILRSSGTFLKLIGDNAKEIIFGNENRTIQKNKTETIAEDSQIKIGKNGVMNVAKNYSMSVGDTFALTSTQGTQALIMDSTKGKESIFLNHKTGAQLVMDKDGSVKLTAKDGSFLFFDATTGAASIVTKAGDVISAKEGIVISDSAGTELLKMKDGKIEISAKQDVVVSATNVSVNAGSVSLGAGAALSAVLAEKLVAAFNMHLHPTPTGPSGPPVMPLLASGTPAPNDIASGSVKLKA